MKSGTGGARYDKDGNLLTGRPPGVKNKKPSGKRITPTISQKNYEWLQKQGGSYGKILNYLIDKVRLVR